MFKKLVKFVVCCMAVLAIGLLLMGNADAAKKQKPKEIIAYLFGYEMPDMPGPDNFLVLGEYSVEDKEECFKELGPEADAWYTKENQSSYPGKKIHVECRPVYY